LSVTTTPLVSSNALVELEAATSSSPMVGSVTPAGFQLDRPIASLIDLTEDEVMYMASSDSESESTTSFSAQFGGHGQSRWQFKKSEVPRGDPVVMQYPLAGGLWATMALYVDRDPHVAMSRFSDIRTRQMSDIKPKLPQDIGAIVGEVIEDEKQAML
jgi:hypothetical protein